MATPVDTPNNFIYHKMKLSPGSFFFLFFLIMEHYFSEQYGLTVGGQLIFGPQSCAEDPLPPLVCIHSFVLFSAAYWLCPSEKPGSWAIARGSKRSSSDQVNRLHKTCTNRKRRPYLHNVDLRDLTMQGGCELWNLIDCLSFIWSFTPPLCNMVLLSTFVIDYMHAFAWI